jgi:hypothetical protein
MPVTTFAAAMKHYFGLKPGQMLTGPDGFMAELKALDQKDRDDFSVMLRGAGYELTEKPAPPAEPVTS